MRNGTLRGNIIARLWRWFWRPAGLISFGLLLVVGFGGGIVFWGGFHWALEITNTEQFCISCHEMRDNVYAEYVGSVHDANASGVRATCPDCHVPKPWAYKMKRKIQASNEVLHKVLGSIDTREKFEAKRLELATHVWVAMKETDSRECRNCHNFQSMDISLQSKRARDQHQTAQRDGETCIDCHKGIAHELPEGALDRARELDETWGKK
jgi:cytochrome c-type protein NapC